MTCGAAFHLCPPYAVARKNQPPFFREALWHLYGGKCGYQEIKLPGRPDGPDFEVDHIIPIELASRPQELKRVLEAFGRPHNFDLESSENLIPTTKLFNLAKGARTEGMPWRAVIEHGLRRAEATAPNIQSEMRRLAQEHSARNAASARVRAEEAFQALTTQKGPWTPEFLTFGGEACIAKEADVAIHCFLPTPGKLRGSAMLAWREGPGTASISLTFDHRHLLTLFVRGLAYKGEEMTRPYIHGGDTRQETIEIRFPSSRVWVSSAIAKQMVRVGDQIGNEYLQTLLGLENTLFESTVASVTRGGRLSLGRLTPEAWEAVLRFGREKPPTEQAADGVTWRAAANATGLEVTLTQAGMAFPADPPPFTSDTAHEGAGPTARFKLIGEPVVDHVHHGLGQRHQVEVCWVNPLPGPGLETALRSGEVWSVRRVQEFLADSLLPVVREYVSQAATSGRSAPSKGWWPRKNVVADPGMIDWTLRAAGETYPAPWERIEDDAEALADFLLSAVSWAEGTRAPLAAVLEAQRLLEYALRSRWLKVGESHAWPAELFDLGEGSTEISNDRLIERITDLSARDETLQPSSNIFRALGGFAWRDLAATRRADAEAYAEFTALLARRLRPLYRAWWGERIAERDWHQLA